MNTTQSDTTAFTSLTQDELQKIDGGGIADWFRVIVRGVQIYRQVQIDLARQGIW